jgi:hypothetical protein
MPASVNGTRRKKVFISYRRQDALTQARRIAAKLESKLNCDAFVDESSIDVGADWLKIVEGAIEKADMVLVLIGPTWLAAADFNGKSRLLDSADVVRREIVLALKKTQTLIPVLLDGARMPASNELPDALVQLTKLQAYDVRASQFDDDVDALIGKIGKIFEREDRKSEEFWTIAERKGVKLMPSHELSFSTFLEFGDWVVKIRLGPEFARQLRVDLVEMAFTITDNKFNGTETVQARNELGQAISLESRMEGIYKIRLFKEPSGERIVKALVLEGVNSKKGPFEMEIAFDRRLGDVYVGTDRFGNQFESRLIKAAPVDSL